MSGCSSWMPYGPQGVKGFDDDDRVMCMAERIARLIMICNR